MDLRPSFEARSSSPVSLDAAPSNFFWCTLKLEEVSFLTLSMGHSAGRGVNLGDSEEGAEDRNDGQRRCLWSIRNGTPELHFEPLYSKPPVEAVSLNGGRFLALPGGLSCVGGVREPNKSYVDHKLSCVCTNPQQELPKSDKDMTVCDFRIFKHLIFDVE
jgi:hypothetical protein